MSMQLSSKQKVPTIKTESHLARDFRQTLVSLDPSELKKHPASRGKGQWRGRFTVATWVRFPEGLTERVSLSLAYRDARKRKHYRIDACRANNQTLILLNGTIDVEVDGDITGAALMIKGLSESSIWVVDQYRIEPVTPALGRPITRPTTTFTKA